MMVPRAGVVAADVKTTVWSVTMVVAKAEVVVAVTRMVV